MRTKNQETLDRILKFVNKYYQEHHSSPTINDVAEGVGVARSTTHRYLQELSDRNLIDYSRGILSAPQSAKMKTAYVSAPLVGSIRCGNPEDEEESIEEYVSLPVSMFGKGDFYILRAKGDSMVDAGIDEDDLLVIERNCPALEGDIVVALDEDNQNTQQDYRDMKADYERQTIALTDVLARLNAERAELANGVKSEHPALVAFTKHQNIDQLSRELLVELIDHIKVYENGNISVRFKFADEFRRIAEYIEINTTKPAVAG